MRAPDRQYTTGNFRLVALPILLLISACSGDNSLSPGVPDAASPLSVADLSRHDCFSHHLDCVTPQNGRIAYSRFVDDKQVLGLFSARPDGGDVRQLTVLETGVYDDASPDWSPDGNTIVFERDYLADGTHQFFLVNADGSGLTQLTHCEGECLGVANASYSPDGRHLAFAEALGNEVVFTVGIWIMNADGTDPIQVTQQMPGTGSSDQWAAWSPDGRKLAFTRYNDSAEPAGHSAIFVGNLDGSGIHRVTPWQLNAGDADWSSDGTLLVLSAHYDIEPAGNEQLYTVHPDGSHLTAITPSGLARVLNYEARFSPDGRRIIFAHRTPTTAATLYSMKIDGSDVRPVAAVSGVNYGYPAWGTHR